MTIIKVEICASKVPFDELPSDLGNIFNAFEKEAYNTGIEYFKASAKSAGELEFATMLGELDSDAGMRVYLEKEEDGQWFAWFEFTFSAGTFEVRRPRFRVGQPDEKFPMSMPERLRRIYGAFGGINLDASGDYGLLPPEKIHLAAPEEWKILQTDPADKCWIFHSWGNGDYNGWLERGGSVMLCHEGEQEESRKEDLDEFLDDFMCDNILE